MKNILENNERRLEHLRILIDEEIEVTRNKVNELKKLGLPIDSEAFQLRGRLYSLAFEVSPDARHEDVSKLFEWLEPVEGEKSVDISAGTGFLTTELAQKTKTTTYAVDPSSIQLDGLKNKIDKMSISGEFMDIKTVVGNPADIETFDQLGNDKGQIDFIASYGGIHHIVDKNNVDLQRVFFKNIKEVLKTGGRFVAGDVGAGTTLADHFEKSVKTHCLTGHEEKWLNPDRLKELCDESGLVLVRTGIVPVKWSFSSEMEMALFMKALHAYDMSDEEILKDLSEGLGYKKDPNGNISLNWPMLFFKIVKP